MGKTTAAPSAGDEGSLERLLTVAKVRTSGGLAEVMFFESARIYRLTRDSAAYEQTLRRLRTAERAGQRIRVRFNEPNGDIVERVVANDAS
jgi:hypothetical protein